MRTPIVAAVTVICAVLAFPAYSQKGGDHGTLRLTPTRTDPQEITAEDRAAILRWKPHLLALVDYCEAGVVESATGK